MSTTTTTVRAGLADFVGMDRETGRAISGTAHLAQSIGDILTTRIGSRVERRAYGSTVPDYIDMPMTAVHRTRMYGAAALALLRWEPRLKLARIDLLKDTDNTGMQGRHVFAVDLQVHDTAITLEVPV
jgi:phage baseplate assembly protein W